MGNFYLYFYVINTIIMLLLYTITKSYQYEKKFAEVGGMQNGCYNIFCQRKRSLAT